MGNHLFLPLAFLLTFFTFRIPNGVREGNVFTGVCLFIGDRGYHRVRLWPGLGYPLPGQDWRVPSWPG